MGWKDDGKGWDEVGKGWSTCKDRSRGAAGRMEEG